MSATTLCILCFVTMLVMTFCGVPVFVSMLTSAFAGFLAYPPLVLDVPFTMNMIVTKFGEGVYALGANYNYAVLPLFSLVGSLVSETGVAEGAFECFHRFLARVKGGLLYTVVCANAVFGACSGSSIAGNIVFGRMSIPELRRRGYDEKLCYGTIASSGALSTLIPPSMGILMFCIIAPSDYNLSIKNALSCGIFPGVVTAIALCLTIFIVGTIKKGAIPDAPKEGYSAAEKLKSLAFLLPILLLFMLIIGGTMLGWFPAVVGGAVGAAACLIYAAIKRMSFKRIWACIVDAAVMEAGIFPIIVGGQIFSNLVSLTGLANYLSQAVASLDAPRYVVFLLVIALYVFCGCIMDMMSIIIITVPVVFPILCNLGYSPYSIVISLCFIMEIAGLTPPVGMNVFATSNALRVSPSKVFAGVWPFFICEMCMVLLIAFVPGFVTFFPELVGIM